MLAANIEICGGLTLEPMPKVAPRTEEAREHISVADYDTQRYFLYARDMRIIYFL